MQKKVLKILSRGCVLQLKRFKSKEKLGNVAVTLLRFLIILNPEKFQLRIKKVRVTDFHAAK